MSIKSIEKSIFAKVLPTIAATMGGPLAQMGVNAIIEHFGGKEIPATHEGLDAAIIEAQKTDPNILEKLKVADNELKLRLVDMGYKNEAEILALQNADRADARAREIAVKDWTPQILAYAVTIGFFGVLAIMSWHQIPDGSVKVMDVMLGSLGTAWIGIVGYYFGSSSGSAAKTKIIADQAAEK